MNKNATQLTLLLFVTLLVLSGGGVWIYQSQKNATSFKPNTVVEETVNPLI